MSMRNFLLLASIMMLSMSLYAFSQDTFYYYRGKQEKLSTDRTTVAVVSSRDAQISLPPLSATAVQSVSTDDYQVTIVKSKEKSTPSTPLLRKALESKFAGNEDFVVLPCFISSEGMELYQTLDINLKLKRESDVSLLNRLAKEYQLKIARQNQFMPLWYTVSVTPKTGKTTVEIANLLFETHLFDAVSPNFLFDGLECSYDPDFEKLWGLYNAEYLGVDMSICSAWNYATGQGVKIAIVDQGIELTHPDLAENCYILSYDTETSSSPSRVYGDHGTHCAGIAAAVRNNGLFVAGVAPEAKLISVSNRLISASVSNLANGINWAWNNGADIISCSWWCNPSEMIEDAIDNALFLGRNRKGCIFLKSAGNNGTASTPNGSSISYPGDYRAEVLTVGSISKNGERSYFSSTGPALDVVAPGSNIYSTVPNGGIDKKNGTSMATPHVAGLAALILERNPQLTGQQVRNIIEKSTKKVGSTSYNVNVNRTNGTWNSYYGYGLVDAHKALLATPLR